MKTRFAMPLRLCALLLCAGALLPVPVGAQDAAPAKPAVQEKKAATAAAPKPAASSPMKKFKADKQYEEAMAADHKKPDREPVQAVPVCATKPFLCNDPL